MAPIVKALEQQFPRLPAEPATARG
jgi:hypothetical protein